MGTVLFLMAFASFFGGYFFFAEAKSALHQIEGLIMFLIAAVFFVGGAIVRRLSQPTHAEHARKLRKKQREEAAQKEARAAIVAAKITADMALKQQARRRVG